jgi:hypothetical protein
MEAGKKFFHGGGATGGWIGLIYVLFEVLKWLCGGGPGS